MASPPVVVAVVLRADAGGVGGDLEGARRLSGAGEAAKLVVGWQDDPLVGRGAQKVREACRRSVQLELHGEVIDLRDASWREGALERRDGLGSGVGIDQAVVGR